MERYKRNYLLPNTFTLLCFIGSNYCWITPQFQIPAQCMTKSNDDKKGNLQLTSTRGKKRLFFIQIISNVLTFDFAGSLATREHVWSVGRLLGNYECEKISPRYVFQYGEWVSDFLVRCKQLSSWNFNNFLFRLLRVTFSGSAKQVHFNSSQPQTKDLNGIQWIPTDFVGFNRIPMDFCGLFWIQLDSNRFC